MRLLASILISTTLLLTGVAAAANTTPTTHYRWRDAHGVVHFADTIPASALAFGYDIVDNQGMVVRHIGRELTAAERRAAAAKAAQAAAARQAARQKALADQQLLAAYPTAADLRQSQQAQLKQFQFDIDSLKTNLRSQEQNLTDLLAHAADLEHSGQTVTSALKQRIADQRQTVNDERNALTRKQDDLVETRQKFDADLKHYRALRARFEQAEAGSN